MNFSGWTPRISPRNALCSSLTIRHENRDQLDMNAVNETGKYVVHLLYLFTPHSQIPPKKITFLTEIEWLSLHRHRKNNNSTDHIM